MIWRCLYGWMKATVAINAAATIYPSWLPQQNAALPAITYAVDDDQDDQLLSGAGSLKQATVSIDCWATTYLSAHTLADVVKGELVGLTGAFGDLSSSPNVLVTVDHARKLREFDLYESDTRLFRVSLQFLIAYSE